MEEPESQVQIGTTEEPLEETQGPESEDPERQWQIGALAPITEDQRPELEGQEIIVTTPPDESRGRCGWFQ